MGSVIIVEGKIVGQRRPMFPDWRLPLDERGESDPFTLRSLIERVVREEVRAFQDRREERRFVRAISERDIQAGAEHGKITMGGRKNEPDVDSEDAVGQALLAFEDGLYYVFVDDEQVESLDAPVTLRDESRVTFLRLTALAGG